MRLLLTRPSDDAAETAAELRARGHEVILAPILEIIPRTPQELDFAGVQAILITSRNGLRALAAASRRRDLPIYAVGPASAEAARAAGFAEVHSADGDADALADLVRRRLKPDDGALLHPAGTVSAGDLTGDLGADGFTLRRTVLYDARPADRLPDAAHTALANNGLDGVLLFSPRTAESFVSLVRRAGLSAQCRRLTAFCLSEAVARKAREGLAWQEVRVGRHPDQSALLEEVEAFERQATTRGDVMPADEPKPRPVQGGTTPPTAQAGNPAERVIRRFGGLRPMASKMSVPVSTVQGWKVRGHIPHARHEDVRAAARQHGVELDEAELAAADSTLARAGQPASAGSAEDQRAAHRPDEDPGPATHPAPQATASAPAGTDAPGPGAGGPPPAGASGLTPGPAMLVGALLVLVTLAIVIAARGLWLPVVDGPVAGDPAALEQRVGQLEARLETTATREDLERLAAENSALAEQLADLETRQLSIDDRVTALADAASERPGSEAIEDALAPIAGDLENLSRRLRALEDSAADRTALGALSARQQELDSAVASHGTQLAEIREQLLGLESRAEELAASIERLLNATGDDAAVALAVAQLRDALRLTRPFTEVFASLTRLASDDPELAEAMTPLSRYADRGVPNLQDLRRTFPETARAVVTAAREEEAEGWMSTAIRRVSEIIVVRPVGEIPGSDPAAIIARAEQSLAADDLASAVAEMEQLEGAAAAAAADWLAAAEARLTADRVLASLSRLAVDRLTPVER